MGGVVLPLSPARSLDLDKGGYKVDGSLLRICENWRTLRLVSIIQVLLLFVVNCEGRS